MDEILILNTLGATICINPKKIINEKNIIGTATAWQILLIDLVWYEEYF